MKFGDFLEHQLVSEWRSQYLDYNKGKNKLNKLTVFLETSSECQCHDGKSPKTALRGSPLLLDASELAENDSHSVFVREGGDGKSDYQLGNRESIIEERNNFRQIWNDYGSTDPLDKDNYNDDAQSDLDSDEGLEYNDDENNDYKVVSLVDQVDFKIKPKNNENENVPLLRRHSVNRKGNDNVGQHHRSYSTSVLYMRGPQPELSEENKDITKLAKQQFISWVDVELLKVDTFYRNKELDYTKRFISLLDQLEELENEQDKLSKSNSIGLDEPINNQQNCHQHKKSNKKSFFQKIKFNNPLSTVSILARIQFIFNHFDMPSMPNYFWNNHKQIQDSEFDTESQNDSISTKDKSYIPPPPFISKIMIKKAICELYHSIELLGSYKIVNKTAFRKLIKKYDKKCHDSKLSSYTNKVESMYFNKSDILFKLAESIEDLFTEKFEDGHRKTAITKLRSFELQKTHYRSNFISGYLIGISCPFLLFFILEIISKNGNNEYSNMKFVLQLWGSWFLFVLAGLLFAINCVVWDKYKINYKLVFELNPHDALDYKQFLIIPSSLLFIGSIMAYWSMSDVFGDIVYYPYIYFYSLLVILFCPLNVFYLKARIWFIVSIFRLFLSGFYPVEFRDFFMGVITCSLTYSIANIYMMFCLQNVDWTNCGTCGPMKSHILGICACIPPIWRSMQCLRRFLDTGEWFPHFANLAKYLITTSYFFLLSLYRISTFKDEALRQINGYNYKSSNITITVIFILISIINSTYSSFWDICMDWSLMQLSSDNYLLRDVLIYKHKPVYYFAMFIDIVLRFQWIVYVFTPYYISHSPLTAFFVAIAELLRRFIWMFFRMENEHASNVNLFRVSRVCPLPYISNIQKIINSKDINEYIERKLNTTIQQILSNKVTIPTINIMELEETIALLTPSNIINNNNNSNIDLESICTSGNYDIQDDAMSIYSAATQRTSAIRTSGWQQLSHIISRAHAKEFQQRDQNKNINNNGNITGSDIDDNYDLREELNLVNDNTDRIFDNDDDDLEVNYDMSETRSI